MCENYTVGESGQNLKAQLSAEWNIECLVSAKQWMSEWGRQFRDNVVRFFLVSCVLYISCLLFIHLPPRHRNQVSVSFSCLLSDNHVCHKLYTTYHNAACLYYYKQYRNISYSHQVLKTEGKTFLSYFLLNVFCSALQQLYVQIL